MRKKPQIDINRASSPKALGEYRCTKIGVHIKITNWLTIEPLINATVFLHRKSLLSFLRTWIMVLIIGYRYDYKVMREKNENKRRYD